MNKEALVLTITNSEIVPQVSLIARFMGQTRGPSGADRTQVGPMLAPWTLLSGIIIKWLHIMKLDGTKPLHAPILIHHQWNTFQLNFDKIIHKNSFINICTICAIFVMPRCIKWWHQMLNDSNLYGRLHLHNKGHLSFFFLNMTSPCTKRHKCHINLCKKS